jgi:uncharacterized protein (TIGR04255 family)
MMEVSQWKLRLAGGNEMAFPEAPREIYEKNPIEEVICQLRFPTILKIDAEPPAAFQESVRAAYPFYVHRPPLNLPTGLPAELASTIAAQLPWGTGASAHEFTSKDEKWILALTRDFLALTCRQYDRWENFKDHLCESLHALTNLYAPAFFTRIGLRYRDLIRRSSSDLQNVTWSELLQDRIAGVLSSPQVSDDVERSAQQFQIRLPEDRGRLLANHGTVFDDSTKELCYVIDADFFQDKQTEPPDALECLDFLHHDARLFFRWCIKDRLHVAMRPRPLPGA